MTESESVSACVLKKKQLAKQLDERSGDDSHVSEMKEEVKLYKEG